MITSLRLAGLALLVLLSTALPAWACSCMRSDSAAAQAENADLVFVGQVLHSGLERDTRTLMQRIRDIASGRGEPLPNTVTTFQISELLKGEADRDVSLVHLDGRYSATCGIDFARRTQVLVLAYARAEGGYGSSLCHAPQFPIDDFRTALSPG